MAYGDRTSSGSLKHRTLQVWGAQPRTPHGGKSDRRSFSEPDFPPPCVLGFQRLEEPVWD